MKNYKWLKKNLMHKWEQNSSLTKRKFRIFTNVVEQANYKNITEVKSTQYTILFHTYLHFSKLRLHLPLPGVVLCNLLVLRLSDTTIKLYVYKTLKFGNEYKECTETLPHSPTISAARLDSFYPPSQTWYQFYLISKTPCSLSSNQKYVTFTITNRTESKN